MKSPLCRYCEKPMEINYIDYTDVIYKCSCDGYRKDLELREEINKLKSYLIEKERQLDEHRKQSAYEKKLKKQNDSIRKIEESFYEPWM